MTRWSLTTQQDVLPREGCVKGDRTGLAQEPPRVHWVLQSKDVSIVKKFVLLARISLYKAEIFDPTEGACKTNEEESHRSGGHESAVQTL